MVASTSYAYNSVRFYVGFLWCESKFLCQDANVMSLADKCIVVRCFVCGDYYEILKILFQTFLFLKSQFLF